MRNSPARVVKRNLRGYAAHMLSGAHDATEWAGISTWVTHRQARLLSQVCSLFGFAMGSFRTHSGVARGHSRIVAAHPPIILPFQTERLDAYTLCAVVS